MDHEPTQALNTDGISIASLDTPIPDTNIGYRMLQKLGWTEGRGLGREESGRTEPVRGGESAGLRFGVGKAEEDSLYTSEENITRRKLETEAQLEETEEQARQREMKAEHQEKIKEVVKEEMSTFYCELCNKQYKTAMELETHLSSYDHHHKKRLQEMKQMQSERTKGERQKREKKRLEKEMAQMAERCKRARQQAEQSLQGGSAGGGGPAAAAAVPAPVPEQRQAMAFSLGGGARRGGMATRGARGGGRGAPGPKPGLAAFALDSDSDEQ
uniref:G patch domain-containing protein 8-like n=1 Tax=Tetraselmis sp. GSL018 TaxID=582737 RepID=A0A061RQK4_9CHLO